jgi:hypothetical protein
LRKYNIVYRLDIIKCTLLFMILAGCSSISLRDQPAKIGSSGTISKITPEQINTKPPELNNSIQFSGSSFLTPTSIPISSIRRIQVSIPDGADALSLSPDGQWVIRFGKDNNRPLELISTNDPTRSIPVPYDQIEDKPYLQFGCWSPDSKAFLVQRFLGVHAYVQITIYRFIDQNKIERSTVKVNSFDSIIVWSPDSSLFATSNLNGISIINLDGQIINQIPMDEIPIYLIWTTQGIFMPIHKSMGGSNSHTEIRFYDPSKHWNYQTLLSQDNSPIDNVVDYDSATKQLLLIGSNCITCDSTLWVYNLVTNRTSKLLSFPGLDYDYEYGASSSLGCTAINLFDVKNHNHRLYLFNWSNMTLSDSGLIKDFIGWETSLNGFAITTENLGKESVYMVYPQQN